VQVLERASGKGKREIELLVAELAPKPDVPNRMRKLPEASPVRVTQVAAAAAPTRLAAQALCASEASIATRPGDANRAPLDMEMPSVEPPVSASRAPFAVEMPSVEPPVSSRRAPLDAEMPSVEPPVSASRAPFAVEMPSVEPPVSSRRAPLDVEMPSVASPVSASRAPFALEAPRARASSTPLSPGRYKLELTAGQALHDKLQQLKNLLRHQVPDGDLACIVERAVDLLLDKTVKQRFAQTTRAPSKPRAIKRSRKPNSRYIPRAVIREVHQRDAGQCTFMSPAGKRCCERGFLEFHHHDVPYGRGGKATADNLRLACRAHNALLAERDFGTAYMRSKLLHARARAHAVHEPPRGAVELGPERVQA
jgi:hypothetical protein